MTFTEFVTNVSNGVVTADEQVVASVLSGLSASTVKTLDAAIVAAERKTAMHQFLMEHPDQSFTLAEMAEVAGYSAALTASKPLKSLVDAGAVKVVKVMNAKGDGMVNAYQIA